MGPAGPRPLALPGRLRPANLLAAPIGLVLAVGLARGVLYAVVTPPWQAPDEIAHFEHSLLLARHQRPLTPADASAELEAEIIGTLYTFRAWEHLGAETPAVVPARLDDVPVFGISRTIDRFSWGYVPYALVVTPFLGAGLLTQLYVMRLFSVLLGVGTAAVAFATARQLEPDQPALAVGAALFVVFLPQHSLITASVNDGNSAELAASLGLYWLARLFVRGLSARRVAACLVCVLAAILSKATAYFLVPVLAVGGLGLGLRWWRGFRPGSVAANWARLAVPVVFAAGLAGAALVFWDRFSTMPVFGRGPIVPAYMYSPQGLVAQLAILNADNGLFNAMWETFASFWAYLGWMVLPLGAVWYKGLLGAVVVAIMGWLAGVRRRVPGTSKAAYSLIVLAAVLPIAVVFGWFVFSPIGAEYSQGRYLFAGLVPIALVLVRGWLALVSERRANVVIALMLAAGVLLDAVVVWGLALPYFYSSG